MKRLLLVLVGVVLAGGVRGQVAYPPPTIVFDPQAQSYTHAWDDELYHWWWGYTPTQVRDKILAEPGWKVGDPEEDDSRDPDMLVMMATYTRAQSPNTHINLFFTFYKRTLISRAYYFSQQSALAGAWGEEANKWLYDEQGTRWLDKGHDAEIKRQYHDPYVMYVVTLHHEDEKKK
ncbi:MAG: hypothetical protein ACRYFX_18935 [Janthinobacterium lividum]